MTLLGYLTPPTGDRLEAYRECQKRGHKASGISLPMNPPWSVCEFCGVAYRYESVLRELNPPAEAST